MNPNCVVCPETASQAVIMEGVAREVKDSNLLQRFGAVYRKKYDWDMGNLENSKDPIYAIRPMAVFGFVENSKRIKGNPTRWKLTRRPRPKKT